MRIWRRKIVINITVAWTIKRLTNPVAIDQTAQDIAAILFRSNRSATLPENSDTKANTRVNPNEANAVC